MGICKSLIAFVVPVMVFAFASPSHAQSSSTSVRGTIIDAKGAVVSRAEVTLANEETGFSRTVYTNDQGVYQFLEIPPNSYSLTIWHPVYSRETQYPSPRRS
jgi:hypothetical protein